MSLMLDVVWIVFTKGALAGLWLAAALGLGAPLRRWLAPRSDAPLRAQAALGVAAMLLLDAAAGRLGLLQLGGSIGAWAALLPGVVLLFLQIRREKGDIPLFSRREKRNVPFFVPFFAAGPAILVLLLAACSAPGWLWASEFGGYDALSYHLQLPAEWFALGRLQGLEHNVYSFFPSFVEGAYYHLFALAGGDVDAAYACQLLHAGLAVFAAAVVAGVARRIGGPFAGAAAAVLVLGTPWVPVVGSLAYNEMAVVLLFAGALLLVDDGGIDARRGLAIGLLLGAACGAKLTAVGFVALPVAAALLISAATPAARKSLLPAAAGALVAGVLTLAPYLVGNAIETRNPCFPFLTGIFGSGHWTSEQVVTFAHGHAAEGGLAGRVVAGWNQLPRYGFGAPPGPREPWQPQWSILPWLALAGAGVLLVRGEKRREATTLLVMIALQTAFWLAFTHIKSRFWLPGVVPAALLTALGLGAVASRSRAARVVAATVLLAYGLLPIVIFAREANGRPTAAIGATGEFTGDTLSVILEQADLDEAHRRALLAEAPAAYFVNHAIDDAARVLFVGEATPFYYRGADIAYQTTWDRGPLSAAMRAAPDDAAAWMAALEDAGFTHLLVNSTMLRLWEDAGWNDPLLTADRVVGAAEGSATLLWRSPSGLALYRLAR